jgi:WD40 repeat protein
MHRRTLFGGIRLIARAELAMTVLLGAISLGLLGHGAWTLIQGDPKKVLIEPVALTTIDTSVYSLAYSPDGRALASTHMPVFSKRVRSTLASVPVQVKLWDTLPHEHEPCTNVASFSTSALTHPYPTFSADGTLLFVAAGQELLEWDRAAQRLKTRDSAGRPVLSADGRTMARPGAKGVDVIDLGTGQVRATLPVQLSYGLPSSLSPDGQLLAASPIDTEVRASFEIWDTTNKVRRCQLGRTAWSVMAFSSDSRLFAAMVNGGDAAELRIWNTTSGSITTSIPVPEDDLWCLAFHPQRNLLAYGVEEDTGTGSHAAIHIWDVDNRTEVLHLKDESTWAITALCFSPNGRTLASGCGNGQIKFWPLPDELKSGP